MNNRNRLFAGSTLADRFSAFCSADPDPAPAAPTAEQAAAWTAERTTLAGGNADRAKTLESFDTPDAFWSKVGAAPPEAPDPHAWRKAMAGDDPAELAAMERYADPMQARKAWKAATDKISQDGRIKVPGDAATAEEKAEYAKAMGVPDKPDGYAITAKPAEGLAPTETDTAFLSAMTTKLDAALRDGAKPNDIVNLAHQLYYDAAADAAIAAEERAADAAVAGEEVNRALWGSKYDANIKWALAGAKRFFPGNDEAFEQVMGRKLENGCALFDDPVIQQMFLQVGMEHGEDPFMLAAREGGRGFDPQKRVNEIQQMRVGTSAQRIEYARLSAPGGELEKLKDGMARTRAA
jgi:hypothetical protein